MIKEKTLEILEAFRRCMIDEHGWYISDLAYAVEIAIETLEATMWIPVVERLPEESAVYLCTIQSGENFSIMICSYNVLINKWLPLWHGNHDNVTAWMPLPKPWRGEEDECKRNA